MKVTRLFKLACLGSLGVLASVAVIAADIPAGKETISIDQLPGKKGTVEFPHAKHSKEFKDPSGAAIACKNCHHTAKDGEAPKACGSCHVKPGEAEKDIGGKKAAALATMKSADKVNQKSVIYHQRCRDACHKKVKIEGKKIGSCKACHKKK